MEAHSKPADDTPEAQSIAERTAKTMYGRDAASKGLGMKLAWVAPGRACMTMEVRADMLNGHGSCQGGFIFALADSTFAFACNSRNDATVAAAGDIDFIRPGQLNDMLKAEAVESELKGRTGFYEVRVTNQSDEVVALFRGRSHRVRGEVISNDAW